MLVTPRVSDSMSPPSTSAFISPGPALASPNSLTDARPMHIALDERDAFARRRDRPGQTAGHAGLALARDRTGDQHHAHVLAQGHVGEAVTQDAERLKLGLAGTRAGPGPPSRRHRGHRGEGGEAVETLNRLLGLQAPVEQIEQEDDDQADGQAGHAADDRVALDARSRRAVGRLCGLHDRGAAVGDCPQGDDLLEALLQGRASGIGGGQGGQLGLELGLTGVELGLRGLREVVDRRRRKGIGDPSPLGPDRDQ